MFHDYAPLVPSFSRAFFTVVVVILRCSQSLILPVDASFFSLLLQAIYTFDVLLSRESMSMPDRGFCCVAF